MKGIEVIEINQEQIHDLPEENIQGVFLPATKYNSASVGIVRPHETQTKHYHRRPGDGYEIIFIYEGKCVLRSSDGGSKVYDVDNNGPVLVYVHTNTIAYIENVGDTEVRFFTVFAPALEFTELVFFNE